MDSNLIGKAGEHRVLSELLLRGFNPAIRIIDNGIDIVLEDGITIQVKASGKLQSKGCIVTLVNARYKKGKRIDKKFNMFADFLVIWVITNNDFYIIPKDIVKGVTSITINDNSRYDKFKNRWDLIPQLKREEV